MRTFEGHVVGGDIRIGIVAARFNEFIVGKLVAGALDGLKRHEVDEDRIDIAWVPGAFEIPLICQKMVKSGKYDAIIAREVSKGIANVALNADIPVMFGVLTTENIEQAIERAGSKAGNKGYDCALGALEMVNLIREIEEA